MNYIDSTIYKIDVILDTLIRVFDKPKMAFWTSELKREKRESCLSQTIRNLSF